MATMEAKALVLSSGKGNVILPHPEQLDGKHRDVTACRIGSVRITTEDGEPVRFQQFEDDPELKVIVTTGNGPMEGRFTAIRGGD